VETLTALTVSAEERAQARATVLAALPTADPWRLTRLVETLTALTVSAEERAQARAAVLAALPTAGGSDARRVTTLLRSISTISLRQEWTLSRSQPQHSVKALPSTSTHGPPVPPDESAISRVRKRNVLR